VGDLVLVTRIVVSTGSGSTVLVIVRAGWVTSGDPSDLVGAGPASPGGVKFSNDFVVSISEGSATGPGDAVIAVVGGRCVKAMDGCTSGACVGDGDAASGVFGVDVVAPDSLLEDCGIGSGRDAFDPPPRTSSAFPSSTQPTKTPSVFVIGIAKHFIPAAQVVISNFPALLQVPKFPEMHATWFDSHSVEGLMVEKNRLYACALSRLALC